MDRIPHFMCLGAPKAGTTFLYDLLKRHPGVFLPQVKEIHYFSRDENYTKGPAWYFNHFRDAPENSLVGDISPDYLFSSVAPSRIYDQLGPDVKLIVMLRDPCERAYSHYNMLKARNVPLKDFREEVRMEMEVMIPRREYDKLQRRGFVSKSIYMPQIKRYEELFDRNNMLFIKMDEITSGDAVDLKKRLYRFLGLDYLNIANPLNTNRTYIYKNWETHNRINSLRPMIDLLKKLMPENTYTILKEKIKLNLGKVPKPLSAEFRSEMLTRYFRKDIEELEEFLGCDLHRWKS